MYFEKSSGIVRNELEHPALPSFWGSVLSISQVPDKR
jgi:hypothetical protein